jgi:N-acetylmuramoyl-L-alanine amidase
MKEHSVKQGESIKSIAYNNGFYWETIWDHPANKKIKEIRKNADLLNPGDIVIIPEKKIKKAELKVNSMNRIVVKGHSEKFRVQFVDDEDKPRSGINYTLTIDKKFYSGTTDGSGWAEKIMPRNAKVAHLYLGDEEDKNGKPLPQEEYVFDLRHLDPIETVSGVQQRLTNLGFDCGEEEEAGNKTKDAIYRFQRANNLMPTGMIDEITRNKIKLEYGC